MKKTTPVLFAVLFAAPALLPASAYAGSLLRVACYDDNEGATIYINGVNKGECSADVPVSAGSVTVQARKMVDAEHERVWQKTVEMLDNVPKRVEVQLSGPQLTAAAQRQREEQAAKQRQAEAQADLQTAKQNDVAAIERVIRRYQQGDGLKADAGQAKQWLLRLESAKAARVLAAAEGGSAEAMEDLVQRYEQGNGVTQDAAKARQWRERLATIHTQKQAEERRTTLLAKKKEISFFETTLWAITGGKKLAQRDEMSGSTTFSFIILYLPAWLAMDAASVPFKISEQKKIDKELEELALRPAAWGNPDSLIARAAQQSAR